MKKRRLAVLMLSSLLWLYIQPAMAGDKKSDVDQIGDRSVAHKSIISQDKEIAIGKQYADQIDKQAKIVKDPVIAEYVNRIAQNLARNSDLKIPLTVKVIDDPAINAFTLPGGFLYVNTGVLKAADEEDQVAGVLAHEIAHAAARHWASQMTKASILQYATIPLIFIPMTYPVYMGVSTAFNLGVPLTFLKFSRSAEAEADYLGLQYMYKAGYDPNAYVNFFGKIVEEERRSPGSVPKIFQDHPPTADRIIQSEKTIKEILPQKEQYLVSTSEFDDVKAHLRVVLANLKKPEDANRPTLRKRAPDDSKPTDGGSTSGSGSDKGDDTPPVLKRRG